MRFYARYYISIDGKLDGEAESFESLDRSGDRRWFDAEGVGEFAHTPRRALGQQVERVHLSLLDRLVARAVEPVAHLRTGCARVLVCFLFGVR